MNRLPLYESHRPQCLAEVVGQPKAVQQCQWLIDAGLGGQSVFIAGPSGTGKTTLARIMAATLADAFFTIEVNATEVNAEFIDRMKESIWMFGGGKGGRAWIINEAHLLQGRTIAALLDILEGLKSHCAVFFTTTRAGEEKLFDDQIDSGPLMSRCRKVTLTNQGTAEPFAELAHAIAGKAGLNGLPVSVALKLVRQHKGNMRAILQDVADGALQA